MPALRDELLAQLVKQVSHNPSRDATAKGWELMGLALDAFPPSESFENYLEAWLRSSTQSLQRGFVLRCV
jgi:hypothetical protein